MASFIDRALEPLNVDLHFQVLLHQRITNSFLVARVLLLMALLLFIGFLGFTCREANLSIEELLRIPEGDKRDLNHHVEVVCSTDYKAKNWGFFFLLTVEMVSSFIMMLFLKIWLDKLAYYSCRYLRLPLSKYYQRMVVFNEGDSPKVKRKLRLWMWGGLCGYLFMVVVNCVIPVTSMILRFSIPSFREFILPKAKRCGPELFWFDDEEFGVEYNCHFEQEWQLMYVVISSDVLLVMFTIWLPFTMIFMYRALQSKYFKQKDEDFDLDKTIMELKH